jgi:hypothetical protein
MYMAFLDHLESKKKTCSPDSVLDITFGKNSEQVLDISLDYLKKSPEHQQREIPELFMDCLKENAKKPDHHITIEDKR